MHADAMSIKNFLTRQDCTFEIPVYQRNYAWEAKECQRLFRDIENMAESGGSHFIGTIVYIKSSKLNTNWDEHIIVDGQQRITTLMLLLKAIYDVSQNQTIKDVILSDYLTNKLATDRKQKLKLKPIQKDADIYIKIIEENEIAGQSSRLIDNYELLKRLVKESDFSPKELFDATKNLKIVFIELKTGDENENPQDIFECINSTGKPLELGDKIRNYLLMKHDQQKQIQLHKDYWIAIERSCNRNGKDDRISDFIKDFLIMKTCSITTKEMVYEKFKKFVGNEYKNKEDKLFAELRRYAQYYSWLIYCDSEHKGLNKKLKQFHAMKSTAANSVLLWFFDRWQNSQLLTTKEIISVVNTLLSYQFRRLVCKYNTNALNSTYESVLKKLEESDPKTENLPSKLLHLLAKKRLTQVFPRDKEFKEAFISFAIYPKWASYALAMLENKLNPAEVIEMTEQISVEHVMPKKLTKDWRIDLGMDSKGIHDKWLHTIGNLTLTGNNSKLGQMRFPEKRTIFLKSNVMLSRELARAAREWNEKTIKKRAESLAETALDIWELPSKYNKQKPGSDEISYSRRYNLLNNGIVITGELPRSYIFRGDEKPVKSWRDMFVGLLADLYEYDEATFKNFLNLPDSKARHLAEPLDTDHIFRHEPALICPGFKTALDFSSSDLMEFMVCAVELYDDLEDEVFFKLRPPKPSEP